MIHKYQNSVALHAPNLDCSAPKDCLKMVCNNKCFTFLSLSDLFLGDIHTAVGDLEDVCLEPSSKCWPSPFSMCYSQPHQHGPPIGCLIKWTSWKGVGPQR